MADITTGIYSGILPGLGSERAREFGFRDWLIKGTYSASSQTTATEIILDNVNRRELVSYVSYDFERFCFASWESFCRVPPPEVVAVPYMAWPLLEAYYSGFFAAHSIMRAMGEGIVKLEREQARQLGQVLTILTGSTPNISAGMFAYRLDFGSGGRLAVRLTPHSDGSGVHESFWKAFVAFLERRAESYVARNLPDAALFVAGVAELAPLMKSDPLKNGAVWYSAIRNEVNYQQKHHMWLFDQRKGAIEELKLLRRVPSSVVRLDASAGKEPILAFSMLSQFLACLNWEVAERVAATATRARTFGPSWRKLNAALQQHT